MKEKILQILMVETEPTIRFEVLEKFFHYVDCSQDVEFLINLFDTDNDPCVLHEISAQLFRIEEKKPELMSNLKTLVIEKLVKKSLSHESIVVRHEAIEALGYIGNESCLSILKQLCFDKNFDIKSTALIAYKNTQVRIENNLKASQLCDYYINNWSPNIENAIQ